MTTFLSYCFRYEYFAIALHTTPIFVQCDLMSRWSVSMFGLVWIRLGS